MLRWGRGSRYHFPGVALPWTSAVTAPIVQEAAHADCRLNEPSARPADITYGPLRYPDRCVLLYVTSTLLRVRNSCCGATVGRRTGHKCVGRSGHGRHLAKKH